jgi:hypothetical protein
VNIGRARASGKSLRANQDTACCQFGNFGFADVLDGLHLIDHIEGHRALHRHNSQSCMKRGRKPRRECDRPICALGTVSGSKDFAHRLCFSSL